MCHEMNRRNMMLMTGVAALAAAVPAPQAAAEPPAARSARESGRSAARRQCRSRRLHLRRRLRRTRRRGARLVEVDGGGLERAGHTRRSWACSATIAATCRSTATATSPCAPRGRATPTSAAGWRARHEDRHRAHLGSPDKAELPGSRLLAGLLAGEPRADARTAGARCPTAKSTSSSGTATASGLPERRCTPDPTAGPGRRTGGRWTGTGTPTGSGGTTPGFRFWRDNVDGAPFFTVPAVPIDGVWPFNAPGLPAVHGLQPRGRRSRWR